MKLLFFCPRWGSEDLEWDQFCKKVKQAGYDGVEAGVPFNDEKDQMMAALGKHGLLFIGQYWQSFEKDFHQHKVSYEKHLRHIAAENPLKIDSQTGKDYFSTEENIELFGLASEVTKSTGIPIAHETHRNKALFAAHVTKDFLERIPNLTITADFSHWCNVSESLLEDQQESLEKAFLHTIHIHARVGHSQSAQVTDPRHPEWNAALTQHTHWWRNIVESNRKRGAKEITITPEFGPAPYMPLAPVTQTPLADQWEVNIWMKEYLRKALG